MHRSLILKLLAILAIACMGCETELQKKQREANERMKKAQLAGERALKNIQAFAATADKSDPESVLKVIEKIEEVEGDIRGADTGVQNKYRELLSKWNDRYIRLGNEKFEEVYAAAMREIDRKNYDKAIKELEKFPEVLASRGWIGEKLQKYKEAIAAYKEAPQAAFDKMDELNSLIGAREYEKAREECDRYLRSPDRVKGAAVYIVVEKHRQILGLILDELMKQGDKRAVLDRIEYYEKAYGNLAGHPELLEKKREEIEGK